MKGDPDQVRLWIEGVSSLSDPSFLFQDAIFRKPYSDGLVNLTQFACAFPALGIQGGGCGAVLYIQSRLLNVLKK